MPSIRIANGMLFDPWNPVWPKEEDYPEGHSLPNWDWLGHHLANECRYAGGCKWFYSVAQHSVLASRYILDKQYYQTKDDYKLRLAALLHDATEAVLKDIPGPFKATHYFLGYGDTEKPLMKWFYKQFDIAKYLNAPEIKRIDKELLDAERSVLFDLDSGAAKYGGPIRVEPWDREYARDEFNRCLQDLTK